MAAYIAWVVQKLYSGGGSFSHILSSFWGLSTQIMQRSPGITKLSELLFRCANQVVCDHVHKKPPVRHHDQVRLMSNKNKAVV